MLICSTWALRLRICESRKRSRAISHSQQDQSARTKPTSYQVSVSCNANSLVFKSFISLFLNSMKSNFILHCEDMSCRFRCFKLYLYISKTHSVMINRSYKTNNNNKSIVVLVQYDFNAALNNKWRRAKIGKCQPRSQSAWWDPLRSLRSSCWRCLCYFSCARILLEFTSRAS